jgi:tetratricopeptide (TPR) repeat protein
MVMSLNYLITITWLMGDFEDAIRAYENFIAAGSGPVYQNRAGDLLNCRGNIALAQGQDEAAVQYFAGALAFGQHHDHAGIASMALLGLGRIACQRGEFSDARQKLWEALRLAQKYESRGQSALIYCALARVALAQGDEAGAVECIRQALPLFQMPFYHWAVVTGLEIMISMAARQEQPERAAQLYGAVEKLSEITTRRLSSGERARLVESIQTARAALGEAVFQQMQEKGQAMSLEQAAGFALTDKK